MKNVNRSNIAKCHIYFDLKKNYRKNESYATETGEIITRKTRMHRWGIPLGCVVGVGLGVPAGTVATTLWGDCAAWHEYGQFEGTNFAMNLAFVISTFVIPAVLLAFPLLAIFMQV